MKIALLFISLLLFQCGTNNDQLKRSNESKFEKIIAHSIQLQRFQVKEEVPPDEIEYTFSDPFIDSTSIGNQGRFKIEIRAVHLNDFEDSLYLKLFKKQNGDWDCLQAISKFSDVMAYFSPNFKDFNNDGWNDLTLWTGDAARGANEIRTLFIFDPKKERFITIRNSENYPNLRYNAVLDCIDAWLVYGGSTTVFLKLESDSLIEFAEVSNEDEIRQTLLVDKNGNRTELERIKTTEGCYTRYCNYAPVEICDE